MPNYSLSYPKVRKDSYDNYFIDFNLNSKRYRLFNGKRINSSLAPNSYPTKLRRSKAVLLADEVYRYLASNNYSFTKPLTTLEPYNKDYFKTLFRRFKRSNKSVDDSITLYSFRHSGAIEIFKRTGSITKLQKAMGHSSINVSLTYLRGLEIAELKEEDMPMV